MIFGPVVVGNVGDITVPALCTTYRMIDKTYLYHQPCLPAILPYVHRFKKFFAGRLSNKFVKIWPLKISPHLKCVATLPCDLSLITTLVWKCLLFSDVDVLQGSVATHISCDRVSNNSFIANFLKNLLSKKNWKSVKVWWSYSHEFGVSVFYGARCRWTVQRIVKF